MAGDTNWLDWADAWATDQGLNSALAQEIIRLSGEGFEAESLVLELRKTAAYAARFPAMKEMIQKAGWNEGNYLAYETTMAEYEVQYGLPKGMLTSKEQIAKMATSMLDEAQIKERILVNRAAALQAPAEVKAALQQFYGVTDVDGALTAYYLDPERSVQTLQAELETARIGGAAARYRFEVDEATARRYREQGVTETEAQRAYMVARQQEALTQSMAAQQMVTESDLAAAQFGDVGAQEKVGAAAGARRAAFQGGGGAATGQQGAVGLGSSSE